jgi:hypothetical protein
LYECNLYLRIDPKPKDLKFGKAIYFPALYIPAGLPAGRSVSRQLDDWLE